MVSSDCPQAGYGIGHQPSAHLIIPLMRITVLVPTSDESLSQLSWLLLGLRQQGLTPDQWSLLLLHRGTAAALDQALEHFRARIGQRLSIETLVLPAQTPPATALAAAKARIRAELVLFLQPGYQPHRALLEAHQRFHRQQDGPAIAAGSSQFHPEQALSHFAMACQMGQLLFNFFPLPVSGLLPYTSCRLHNLSMPLALLPELDPALNSWHFCGWDLGIRLWRQGHRLQGLADARSCLTAPLDLDTALTAWLADSGSDLGHFLRAHPFPIPGWELDWPRVMVDSRTLAQLHQRLRQTQAEVSVPVERGDPVEQALQNWKLLLQVLWRGKALEQLQQDTRKPAAAGLYPLPWQDPATNPPALPESQQSTPALTRWRERYGASLTALAARYQGHSLEIGAQPSFLASLGLPWQPLDAAAVPAETELVFLTEGSFDGLLRRFLQLETSLASGALLAIGPLTPSTRRLRELILTNYAWIELDQREDLSLLCRLGPEVSAG